MFDRLLHRGENPGEPRPTAFPAGARCGAGCGETDGYQCSYVDASKARCGWWCRNHSVFMDGRPWCRRHATVVRWLKARQGAGGEIYYEAAMDDRSPNLVAFIVDYLNPEISRRLTESFSTHADARVVIDDQVRPASISPTDAGGDAAARQKAWERGWGVSSGVGFLARVVLRATASEPPVVHLYVNGTHAMSRTPDWIANRGTGTDPEEDRRAFGRAVVESVERAVGPGI